MSELHKVIRLDPSLENPASQNQLKMALMHAHTAYGAMLEYDSTTLTSPPAPPGELSAVAYRALDALIELSLRPGDTVLWGPELVAAMKVFVELSTLVSTALVGPPRQVQF